MHIANFKKHIKNTSKMTLKEVKKNIAKGILSNKYKEFKSNIYYRNLRKRKILEKKTSVSNFKRACIITGNCRSIFQRFKMVRHFCKDYGGRGLITGLRKASF